MQLQDMEAKSNIKDHQLHNFGVPPSSHGNNIFQDGLHMDPFQVYGPSSSNYSVGVQTANFVNPFDNSFSFGCSSLADFDVYESKPFTENINGITIKGNAHVMENNIQLGGNINYSLNVSHERNIQMEMMDADHLMSNNNNSYFPFDSHHQEINKPMINFVLPDVEVPIISADHSFLRRVGLNNNKHRRFSAASLRRACKVRNKSNLIKGQWTVEEDRYVHMYTRIFFFWFKANEIHYSFIIFLFFMHVDI